MAVTISDGLANSIRCILNSFRLNPNVNKELREHANELYSALETYPLSHGESFFPIIIETNDGSKIVCISAEDVPSGISFKVIATKVEVRDCMNDDIF